jgi:hypothetical protein
MMNGQLAVISVAPILTETVAMAIAMTNGQADVTSARVLMMRIMATRIEVMTTAGTVATRECQGLMKTPVTQTRAHTMIRPGQPHAINDPIMMIAEVVDKTGGMKEITISEPVATPVCMTTRMTGDPVAVKATHNTMMTVAEEIVSE